MKHLSIGKKHQNSKYTVKINFARQRVFLYDVVVVEQSYRLSRRQFQIIEFCMKFRRKKTTLTNVHLEQAKMNTQKIEGTKSVN